jgi:hypothetical protein
MLFHGGCRVIGCEVGAATQTTRGVGAAQPAI